jgi:hypothetical protein
MAAHRVAAFPRDVPKGPITITATDPAIESMVERQSDRRAHPDTMLRVATTRMRELGSLYVSGVRMVIIEDEPRHRGRRPDEGGHGRDGGARSSPARP